MRNIILKILLLLVIFTAVNVLIFKISPFYKKQTEYQVPIDDFIVQNSEILILGDSHIQSLRDTKLSKSVGNLAFGADGIIEMYAKATIALKNNSKLKYVLLSTEPQIFNRTQSPNSGFLQKYMFENEDLRQLYGYSILDVIVNQIPLINDDYIEFLRNQLIYKIREAFEGSENTEWSQLPHSDKVDLAIEAGKSDHAHLFESKQDSILYRRLIENFNDRGVKVIGIKFPVSEPYFSQLNESQRKQVIKYLGSLKLSADFDYTTLFTELDNFKDPDHLNKQSVNLLIKVIEKDIQFSLKD